MKAPIKTKVATAVANSSCEEEQTDVANARRMARKFEGALAYAPVTGKWLEFMDHHWAHDSLGHIVQHAITVTEDLMLESAQLTVEAAKIKNAPNMKAAMMAEAEGLLKWARKSQTRQRIEAMVALARTEPALAVDQARLDADDTFFGVQNGVLELADATIFRDGRPDDWITRQSDSEWAGGEAYCPLWERFLAEVQPDPDVRHWLKMFVGYCLTGNCSEQIFVVLHGDGANGKGVFINTIKKLLGRYAEVLQFQSFLEKRSDAIRNDIAKLDKVRLVVAQEGPRGAVLDEGLMKQLTGQDEVAARFLFKDEFTYRPRYKIVLVANHRPVIQGTDLGIWRRVVLVPWNVTIPEGKRDRDLEARLAQELPGILAWAVEGYHLWREQGLSRIPEAIRHAKTEYQAESDVVARWLEDDVVIDEGAVSAGNASKSCFWASSAELV
ncbi:hypothetical protein GALL_304310 [mine drainage metagenome]|uniref:SF3 helicase domain-containing protein n=1 Tax=mine drainage metagenome TaxID=410659 RepID=A0A1J5QVP0_9ZZZZ